MSFVQGPLQGFRSFPLRALNGLTDKRVTHHFKTCYLLQRWMIINGCIGSQRYSVTYLPVASLSLCHPKKRLSRFLRTISIISIISSHSFTRQHSCTWPNGNT